MTIHLRAANPRPTTVNIEDRTIEAIVSTGAATVRPGYIEQLDLRGVDLSRIVGAPVLDGHRSGSTRDQLGVIEAAEMRSEGLWVRLRFRSNEAAKSVLTDIGDGTLRGLSIGYTVAEWKEGRDGKNRVRTATRWTPLEVSIVPVPADAGAHFRNGETIMDPEEQTLENQEDTARQTRAQVNAEIRTMAQTAGLTRAWADEQIDAESSLDDARQAAFDAMRQRSSDTTRTTRTTVNVDNTDPLVIATRAGEALFARSHPDHELSEPARAYAAMSTIDLARDCLRRSGMSSVGMAADTVITRALHTTSDFPLILGDAVGRELRRAYQSAPSPILQLARPSTVRDFKPKRSLQFGDGPELQKVEEGGEFKKGTFVESAESYAAGTFGRIFGISRQAIINDDLGAFTQTPAKMGNAARGFVAQQLVNKLTENPAMSDGDPVFHANHGNLTDSFAVPSFAPLSASRLAMRRQKGLNGELIDVSPKFVVVPPELESAGEQALADIAATKSDDANPFQKLTLVVEPRLTNDEQWYVVADPAMIDGLEYAYLEGAPGPQIETRQGFEVDGVQIKVRLDFGCGWIDHRGWHRVG